MRKLLMAATVCAIAACGGKRTITATPQIKTDVTAGTAAMADSTTSVGASLAVSEIGNSAAAVALGDTTTTLDLSAMPAPNTMHPTRPTVGSGPVAALRPLAHQGTTTVSGTASGCLESDGAGGVLYTPAGQGGCTASGYVDVLYQNGDEAKVTWSGTEGQSFSLTFEVLHGYWTGTKLSFSATGSSTSADLHETGVLKYDDGVEIVDAQFDLHYVVAVTGTNSVTVTYTGSAANHVAGTSYNGTTSITLTSTGTNSGTVEVRASVAVSDGVHTIGLDDFYMKADASSQSAAVAVSGDVMYDGAVCGNVELSGSGLIIAWTDGTTSPFDPSVLGGGV